MSYLLYTYKVRSVHRVVDGDTFDLELDLGFHQFGVYRIRLLGVDAPEVYGKNAVPEGILARDAVLDWFTEHLTHHEVIITTYKSDSFGRWLGDILARTPSGPVLLAQHLLDIGLAEVYRKDAAKVAAKK